jgi:hypothetical protein
VPAADRALREGFGCGDPERRSSKGSSKGSASKGKYRSTITGKYVSAHYGKRHPKTTVRESK